MEAVRTRAGVGKATIYRRWPSKEELVRDAIVFLHEEFETPDTGSLRGDYAALAERRAGERARAAAPRMLMPRLLGESVNDPELFAIFRANLVEPRRAALRTVLERAIDRGEIREGLDLELLLDLFAGPGRLPAADHRRRHGADVLGRGPDGRADERPGALEALGHVAHAGERARPRACSTKRSSIAMRWPRPITCGCMQTVSTPPSTCRSIQSSSSVQISSTLLGADRARRRDGLERELEVRPVVELEAHRQLPQRAPRGRAASGSSRLTRSPIRGRYGRKSSAIRLES